MKLISLDIETSGLDKTNHSILQVGAVFVDTNNYLNDRCILFNINHKEITGSLFALNMNKNIIEDILNSKIRLEEEYHIGSIINNFASSYIHHNKYTIIGKNASVFDIPFINKKSNEPLNCHRRIMDIGVLYTDTNDFVIPDLSGCFEKLGIKHTTKHNALTDSIDVAYLLHRKFNKDFKLSYEEYDAIVRNKIL